MMDFEENEFVLIDGKFYKVISDDFDDSDDGDELVTCYRLEKRTEINL